MNGEILSVSSSERKLLMMSRFFIEFVSSAPRLADEDPMSGGRHDRWTSVRASDSGNCRGRRSNRPFDCWRAGCAIIRFSSKRSDPIPRNASGDCAVLCAGRAVHSAQRRVPGRFCRWHAGRRHWDAAAGMLPAWAAGRAAVRAVTVGEQHAGRGAACQALAGRVGPARSARGSLAHRTGRRRLERSGKGGRDSIGVRALCADGSAGRDLVSGDRQGDQRAVLSEIRLPHRRSRTGAGRLQLVHESTGEGRGTRGEWRGQASIAGHEARTNGHTSDSSHSVGVTRRKSSRKESLSTRQGSATSTSR